MAIRKIVQINTPEGDTVLRAKARKVARMDDELRALARDLVDTVIGVGNGVGLAAPQIGESVRMIAVNVPPDYLEDGDPGFQTVLYNPQIVRRRGGKYIEEEGCLSLRNWYGPVERDLTVVVRAHNIQDREVRIEATGFVARVLQHEIDHLDGVMFTDHMVDPTAIHYVDPNAHPEGDETESAEADSTAADD